MTGFSALPFVENPHESRWIGSARILGPSWTRLPTLTVGLLGVQILWSVEMSYGEWLPYTLSRLLFNRVARFQLLHTCCLSACQNH